jgi:membrane fusion protein (multidrug efflux system)
MGTGVSRIFGHRRCRHATAAAIALAILLAGCNGSDKAAAPPGAPPPGVGVITVKQGDVTVGASFVGRVVAVNAVDLVARVEGFLEARQFTEGQDVKTGDLLFQIEQDVYQAQVDQAAANLASAQATANNAKIQADRAQSLVRTNDVSQATLDDRNATLASANASVLQMQAALTIAQINLGYTQVKAPVDGRISIANFDVGALVQPASGTLATVVSQDPIYVTFPVPTSVYLRVHQRQPDSIAIADVPVAVHIILSDGTAYPEIGKIDYSAVEVDQGTDTVTIRAEFANPKRELIDGAFVQVTVEDTRPQQGIVIPQAAVLTDQAGKYVLIVDADKKAQQRRVTLGSEQSGGRVVIAQGLNDGDTLIVEGLQKARPGQPVTATPYQPAAGGGA